MMRRGIFITFEGVDGAGKTTQAKRLVQALVAAGWPAVYVREPGGCRLGEELRGILLRKEPPNPGRRAELLLFGAARAQVVEEVLDPQLAAGKIVVLDRFIDTTVAYQGYGRGLPADFIESMNAFAIGDTIPDRTYMLLCSKAVSDARLNLRGDADRFESEADEFKEKIRTGFYTQAAKNVQRIRTVDAARTEDEVATSLSEDVLRLIDGLRHSREVFRAEPQ